MKKTLRDDLTVHERQQLARGLVLLQCGHSHAAHECFEDAFRAARARARDLFRALAQLSAAYYLLTLGRARAARSTWNKARRKLALVDGLSNEFQHRVDSLFDTLGATEGCARFVDPRAAASVSDWPVPDTLRHESGDARLTVFGDERERPLCRQEDSTRDAGARNMTIQSSDTSQGFNAALGMRLIECSASKVVAELSATPQHHQPWGIVHGGVYCALVETVCSLGAQLAVEPGNFVVGVDNHTSFLKATRTGTLRATARPLALGRRTQLWEANIENEQQQLVATGRVRLMAVAAGTQLGGEPAGVK
jgi:uncharacterized protein (TIGR00369 family)